MHQEIHHGFWAVLVLLASYVWCLLFRLVHWMVHVCGSLFLLRSIPLFFNEFIFLNADRAVGTAIPAGWVSEAELCVGFLAVSMPTYRPIYRKIVDGSVDGPDASTGNSYQRPLARGNDKNGSHSVKVSAEQLHLSSPSQQGISVTDDVELVHHVRHDGAWVMVPDDGLDEEQGFYQQTPIQHPNTQPNLPQHQQAPYQSQGYKQYGQGNQYVFGQNQAHQQWTVG